MQLKYLVKLLLLTMLGTTITACGNGGNNDTQIQTGIPAQPSGGNGSQLTDPYSVQSFFNAGRNNRVLTGLNLNTNGIPGVNSPELQGATYRFSGSSPELQGSAYVTGFAQSSLDMGFVDVNYIGAFPQNDDSAQGWAEGWTIDVQGNASVWEPASEGTLAGQSPQADSQCPAGTTDVDNVNLLAATGVTGQMDVCQLQRRYSTDGSTITLTNDNIYRLASGFPGTYIGNGDANLGTPNAPEMVDVTLTIEPGTLILGSPGEALIITRGATINAVGTSRDPIVMTSKAQFDRWIGGGSAVSGRGEWAGLALMGQAGSNECGNPCNVDAEGGIGRYGGTNDADNSGRLEYVVIRHAGNDIDGNGNELNGLTFFATGSGTRASHVQVHNGLDDGVEHFGGTTFIDHIVLTGNGDDSFDWGQGYRGGAQFVFIRLSSDDGERGIEADNDSDAPNAIPRSAPVLANFTIVGSERGPRDTDGVLFRRGTGAELHNSIVTGFLDSCLDIDGDATAALFSTSLQVRNSVFWCPDSEIFESGDNDVTSASIQAWVGAPNGGNRIIDPNLQPNGNPNPVSGSDADNNFMSTDYIGAFDPESEDNWTDPWTVSLNGNTSIWKPAIYNPQADGNCPAGTTDEGDQNTPTADGEGNAIEATRIGTMDLCRLARRYDTNDTTMTLTNDNIYLLASGFPGTHIGNGERELQADTAVSSVTLKIEPGTLILGSPEEALIITRGSRIEASGTSTDPIVMTSKAQFDNWVGTGDATSGRGEWAGLALMGRARSNECGTPCNVDAEGGIGRYGGTDDSDSSGRLRYVVIRHAGNDIDGNGNELNGLTFFATGSGTRASYIQVHKGLDDGMEHFGSTDFIHHIVLTDNGDDSFDWGQGYTGGAQFIIVRQAADRADRGIEADNDSDAPNAPPISSPTLANMTLIGTLEGGETRTTQGILFRRGTGAKVWNSIATGFNVCLDIDDAATFTRAGDNAPNELSGDLVFNNSILSCEQNFQEE